MIRADMPTVARIAELVRQGQSLTRIAADHNCSRSGLHHRLMRAGLTPSDLVVIGTEKATQRQAIDWTESALCAQTDSELFFPTDGVSAAPALKLCGGCPVREPCLRYAMDHDEQWGVWGGTTRQQRRRMRVEKTREAA